MADIRGLLFDKDGTLFDFQATWGGWAADLLLDLAGGDADLADTLADRIRFDLAARRFAPDSVVIAGTTEDAVAALLPALSQMDHAGLLHLLVERSKWLAPAEAVPLVPFLARLRARGFVLGLATNDVEAVARAQLGGIGALESFDFVAGADSGHGAKPGPGQCLAFCEASGLSPAEVAMIGDSTHDLHAGAAAGMVTVAVLSGPARREELAGHATVVLPDIGHLPGWLGLD